MISDAEREALRLTYSLVQRLKNNDHEFQKLIEFKNKLAELVGVGRSTTEDELFNIIKNRKNEITEHEICTNCLRFRHDVKSNEDNHYCFCDWLSKFVEPDFYCKDIYVK